MSRALRLAGVIALLGLGAGVIVAAARQLGDFDLPWHLALGRRAIVEHAVPFADDFSYTFRGARSGSEVAADVFLYLLTRVGGPMALQIFAGVVVAALAALLVLRARPAPWPIAVGFAALGVTAAGPWFVVRPALFSFVALAAFLFVIDRHRRLARGLWWLVPLQIVWSNLHGFAALGPPLAIGYAASLLVTRAPGRARVALVAAATLPASLASPFGLDLYRNALAVHEYARFITEWTPTTPSLLLHDLPLVLLGLLTLAGFLLRRPTLFDVALVAGALVFGALAIRLLPLTAIVLAPIAARQLAPLLERARAAPLLVAALGLATAPALAPTGFQYGAGFDRGNLPDGATRFLAASRPAGAMWNFLPFGGWLVWQRYPDVRVFIDGRTNRVFPPAFIERYARSEHDAGVFAALATEYDFQWAVVRARPGEHFSEPIARDPRWTMVYLDDCAAVYVRKDGPNHALAERGYLLLRHLTTPPAGPVAPKLQPALRHDAALALAQDPRSPRARALVEAAR